MLKPLTVGRGNWNPLDQSAFHDWAWQALHLYQWAVDSLMFNALLRRRVRLKAGYWPHIRKPRSYNEFILHRKLYDRSEWLGAVDKYYMREFAVQKLGRQQAEKLLLPLLHVTDRPESIPFDELGEKYIIRASHGCGWNIYAENPTEAEKKKIVRLCRRWLKMRYALHNHEWAYTFHKPKIVIEPFIDAPGELGLVEIKLHMIWGKLAMVQYNLDLTSDLKGTYYYPDWSVAAHTSPGREVPGDPWIPDFYPEMLSVAEGLSAGTDQLRVDFLTTEDRFILSECTVYSSAGMRKFSPRELDFELGALWKAGMQRSREGR